MDFEPLVSCVVNKRAFSGKNDVCEKKQADPVHRPITRRFAAQIASTQQSHAEEIKKSNSTISNANGFGECIFIDDELNPEDLPVPKSLEQTEPMPSESDQMEVEMEDIVVEEPIVDIDTRDANNPLAVVDYIEGLYSYYRKIE